ncbi:uncharacterized protein LOC135808985 [Sycon ciliatum]|uniref:uncharacterized protein LOC135808985 n=1 Tax=Sycon ciliatum TaxID=27933 RepID=UPI0031F61A82
MESRMLPHRRGISTALYALLLLLSIAHCADSQPCSTVYVKLGDASVRDSDVCGAVVSDPCATILRALINSGAASSYVAAGESNCTFVSLQPSRYNSAIACEHIYHIDAVTIDGSQAAQIPLRLANCVEPNHDIHSSWLFFNSVSNVTFQNLELSLKNFSGYSGLSVEYSDNVTVVNSTLRYPTINTSAIFLNNNGRVVVSGCLFTGQPSPDVFSLTQPKQLPQYHIAAILVSQSCLPPQQCNSSSLPYPEQASCCPGILPHNAMPSPEVRIELSTFVNLGIQPNLLAYSSSIHYEDASAIHFGIEMAVDYVGVVSRCTFTNNYSPYDTVLKLYAGPGTTNIKYRIEDSVFKNGWGYVGGAAFFRVTNTSVNASLDVIRTTFLNNTAASEGGAIAISVGRNQFADPSMYETLHFATIDGCNFTSNRVGRITRLSAGGAISIISSSFYAAVSEARQKLPTLVIRHTTLVSNVAFYSSAIYSSGSNISVEDSYFAGNYKDSAVGIAGSLLHLGRNVTFLSNQSPTFGGALALYTYSAVRFGQNSSVVFENNSAVYAGGAIYADLPSSTVDIANLLDFSSNVGLSKPCFMQSDPTAVYSFKPETNNNATVIFDRNRAAYGSSIYATSFTACLNDQSPVLGNLDQNVMDLVSNLQQNIGSGAVWLIFQSAGCPCLKVNPLNLTTYWLYHRDCTREQIYNDTRTNPLYINSDYTELLDNYTINTRAIFESQPDTNGFGVFASPQVMAVPWALSTFEWYYPRNQLQDYQEDELGNDVLISTYISSVTLYPSPGEVFPLQVQMANVYFTVVYTLLQLQIVKGSALLVYNGHVHSYLESLLYVPDSPVLLALAGPPGEEGELRITTTGQISTASLELIIPFRLRPCPLGFYETSFMKTATKKEIHKYVHGILKIRLDDDPNSDGNKLICQCPTHIDGVEKCANGSEIIMSWQYWAGEKHGSNAIDISKTVPLRAVSNLTALESEIRERSFVTSLCFNGYCVNHKQLQWNVYQQSPCIESRTGPICGECEEGFSQAISWEPTCLKCTSTDILLGSVGFLLIFVYCGIDMFLFAYFETGKSAVFDSWVSYEQFIIFLIRRDMVFPTLLNFGYISCISTTPNVLQITAMLYVVPAMFFFWIFLTFQLSRFVAVRRFVMDTSLIVGLWTVLTFSYCYLLYPSFNILACHYFDDDYVLFSNAAIECYSSEHWPFALLAFMTIFFIVIPIPLVLIFMRSSPRIKPFMDIYLSFVKDNRSWYIAYGIGRRILVGLLSAFIVDTQARQLSLAFIVQVFLLLHFVIVPFRRTRDNVWEAMFLSFACLFAFFGLLPINEHPTLAILLRIIYFVPSISAFIYGIITKRRKVLTLIELLLTFLLAPFLIAYFCLRKKPLQRIRFMADMDRTGRSEPLLQNQSPEDAVKRAQDVYHLRDDLLVDVFNDASSST